MIRDAHTRSILIIKCGVTGVPAEGKFAYRHFLPRERFPIASNGAMGWCRLSANIIYGMTPRLMYKCMLTTHFYASSRLGTATRALFWCRENLFSPLFRGVNVQFFDAEILWRFFPHFEWYFHVIEWFSVWNMRRRMSGADVLCVMYRGDLPMRNSRHIVVDALRWVFVKGPFPIWTRESLSLFNKPFIPLTRTHLDPDILNIARRHSICKWTSLFVVN